MRPHAGLEQAHDRPRAALGVGADRLLLDRARARPRCCRRRSCHGPWCRSSVGSWPWRPGSPRRPRAWRRGRAMCCSQPNSSPSSSNITAAPASTRRSEARPIAGLAVRPLVPSEPPHLVPTIRSASVDRYARAVRDRAPGSAGPRRGHARPCRACRRASGSPRPRPAGPRRWIAVEQARAVELLAAERDQQHRADVRMGAQRVHDVLGVAVRVAAGEADQLDAVGPRTASRWRGRRGGRTRPDRRPAHGCGCPCGRPGAR